MLKKFISITAALSMCAVAATTVSAELNYTNARTTKTQTVSFDDSELGVVTTATPIWVHYAEKDGSGLESRNNQFKYQKITESGTSPEIKEGMFGKTSEDRILYVPRTDGDSEKTTSARVELSTSSNGAWTKGYTAGDKIKQSVQVAFDKNTPDAYTYNLQLTGTVDGQNATETVGVANGSTTVFAAKKNSVIFFGTTYPMQLLDSKWYNVEIVYTVGSDSVKNRAELYVDGKYIASADFTLSKDKDVCVPMFGVMMTRNNITFVDGASALPDGTYETGIGHYFDSLVWSPVERDFEYTEIKPVSSNDKITVTNGAVVIDGGITAGAVKNAITAGGNTVAVVSAVDGSELSDDADADGAMLKITSNVSGDIFYKIGIGSMLYSEDFEEENGFSEGMPYKYWDSYVVEKASDAKAVIVSDIGGKKGKSFAINTESAMPTTAWSAVARMEKTKKPFVIDPNLPVVVEMMANNAGEDYVSAIVRLGFIVSGEKAESNAISVASNGNAGAASASDLGKVNHQGQWNKVVVEIDPKTLTLDAYVNGVKKNEEPIALFGSNVAGTIEQITKIYLRTWAANSLQLDGYTAFDDVKIYQGGYDALKDAASIESVNENVVIKGNIVNIPAAYNFTTLKNAIKTAEGTTLALYTDNTFKTAYAPILPIQTGAWLVETTKGGAIHYYQIVTPAGKSSYNAPKIYFDGIERDSVPEIPDGSTVSVAAVGKLNRFNKETAPVMVLAFYDKDGELVNIATGTGYRQGYNRIELNIRNVESLEGLTVKAFIWDDLDGMTPVAAMEEVK